MIRTLTVVTLLALGPTASAQSWQTTDFSEPFPPNGTRVCAEGTGGRICLGLFCHAPGTGLRLGYLNSTYPNDLSGVDVTLTIDDPLLATNMIGTYDPTAQVERVGAQPYFYGTGAIAPDQAPPVIDALKRGTTVYITAAGDAWGLPLRGSAREIARVEALCGPPARPESASAPGMVADSPTPPLRGASVSPPEPAALPSGPPVPSIDAPDVGAARWAPIPPDPAEDVFGTELCHPARPGTDPVRCLRLLCFAEGDDLWLFYVDFGTPSGVFQPGQPWTTLLSDRSGRSAALDLNVASDSRELIAVWQPDPETWFAVAAILSDGILRIDTPHGAASMQTDDFDAEIARTAETCAVPAAMKEADMTPYARLHLVSDADERDETDEVTMRLVDEAHGDTIAEYRDVVGQDLSGFSARAVRVGEDDVLLTTMLCGGGGWFGADGCLVYLDIRYRGRWSNVFTDEALAYGGTIDLDTSRARDGWPAIVINDDAPFWEWNGSAYAITRLQ